MKYTKIQMNKKAQGEIIISILIIGLIFVAVTVVWQVFKELSEPNYKIYINECKNETIWLEEFPMSVSLICYSFGDKLNDCYSMLQGLERNGTIKMVSGEEQYKKLIEEGLTPNFSPYSFGYVIFANGTKEVCERKEVEVINYEIPCCAGSGGKPLINVGSSCSGIISKKDLNQEWLSKYECIECKQLKPSLYCQNCIKWKIENYEVEKL